MHIMYTYVYTGGMFRMALLALSKAPVRDTPLNAGGVRECFSRS